MISYYLERGHDLKTLLNLDRYEKIIYKASMLYKIEERTEEMKTIYGVK